MSQYDDERVLTTIWTAVRKKPTWRMLLEAKHRQREQEEREQLRRLEERWRSFPFPIQEDLKLHLRVYGFDSAQSATALLERLLQAQQAHAKRTTHE